MREASARAARARARPGSSALPLALAISALIHALVLMLSFEAPVVHDPSVAPTATRYGGIRIVRVPAIEETDMIPSDQPRETTALPPPALPTAPAGRLDPLPRSVTERLARRAGDPRLLAPPGPLETPALIDERARLRRRIELHNDSVAAAVRPERRQDWTHRDAEGSRWGLSFDTLHLGGRSFVLRECGAPCPGSIFAPPPGVETEHYARLRMFEDIRRQGQNAETRRLFDARVRAIRDRAASARRFTP